MNEYRAIGATSVANAGTTLLPRTRPAVVRQMEELRGGARFFLGPQVVAARRLRVGMAGHALDGEHVVTTVRRTPSEWGRSC